MIDLGNATIKVDANAENLKLPRSNNKSERRTPTINLTRLESKHNNQGNFNEEVKFQTEQKFGNRKVSDYNLSGYENEKSSAENSMLFGNRDDFNQKLSRRD